MSPSRPQVDGITSVGRRGGEADERRIRFPSRCGWPGNQNLPVVHDILIFGKEGMPFDIFLCVPPLAGLNTTAGPL